MAGLPTSKQFADAEIANLVIADLVIDDWHIDQHNEALCLARQKLGPKASLSEVLLEAAQTFNGMMAKLLPPGK
jgi:hypothetical protein